MLASVYSCRVMVKSVSSCCVRGRRLVLSNPVTYVGSILVQYLNDTKYGKIPKGFKHCATNSITMVIYIFIRKVYTESKQRIYQLQVQNGSINHNIKIHHAATYVTVFVTTSMLV